MARRFNRNRQINKRKKRIHNKVAKSQRNTISKILQAKEHVINLTQKTLTDEEYILLAKGLKFVPTPSTKMSKRHLMNDFHEFSRKMRCKLLFHNKNDP